MVTGEVWAVVYIRVFASNKSRESTEHFDSGAVLTLREWYGSSLIVVAGDWEFYDINISLTRAAETFRCALGQRWLSLVANC